MLFSEYSRISLPNSKQRWGLTWTATVPYRNNMLFGELYTENTHKNFFPNKTNWISIPYDIIFGHNEFVPCCFIIFSCKLAVDGKYWTDSHLMHINWRRDIVITSGKNHLSHEFVPWLRVPCSKALHGPKKQQQKPCVPFDCPAIVSETELKW